MLIVASTRKLCITGISHAASGKMAAGFPKKPNARNKAASRMAIPAVA